MTRAAITIALGLVASHASAQPYEVAWWTVDGGGAQSGAGGTFTPGRHQRPARCRRSVRGQPVPSCVAASGRRHRATPCRTGGPRHHQDERPGHGSVPGAGGDLHVVAANGGPAGVTGAIVADVPPAVLTGVTWTCTASPGSSCPAVGLGCDRPLASICWPAGTATFSARAGRSIPAATGTLANTASITPPSGVHRPGRGQQRRDGHRHADAAGRPRRSRSPTRPIPSRPGATLIYTTDDHEPRPVRSPGMTVTHTLPGAAGFMSSTPGAPACIARRRGLTCALGALAPAAATTVTVDVSRERRPRRASLANTADGRRVPCPTRSAATTPTRRRTAVLVRDRRASSLTARVCSRISLPRRGAVRTWTTSGSARSPYASYEVVVDGASGDLGAGDRPGPGARRVRRPAPSCSRRLRSGPVRPQPALRQRDVRRDRRISSSACAAWTCSSDCGPDDTYRLRAWDTTGAVPRFNNSGSQVTVLLLQNPTDRPVDATVFFWSATGTLLATYATPRRATQGACGSSNTATLPGLAGAGRTITVVHDAPLRSPGGQDRGPRAGHRLQLRLAAALPASLTTRAASRRRPRPPPGPVERRAAGGTSPGPPRTASPGTPS